MFKMTNHRLIGKALIYAEAQHHNQICPNGQPYITHVHEVALTAYNAIEEEMRVLNKLDADYVRPEMETVVVATLLHAVPQEYARHATLQFNVGAPTIINREIHSLFINGKIFEIGEKFGEEVERLYESTDFHPYDDLQLRTNYRVQFASTANWKLKLLMAAEMLIRNNYLLEQKMTKDTHLLEVNKQVFKALCDAPVDSSDRIGQYAFGILVNKLRLQFFPETEKNHE